MSAKNSNLGRCALMAASAFGVAVLSSNARADFTAYAVGGDATAASVQATVDNFRAALGGANNGNAAATTDGRREVNWDGGGATTAAVTTGALGAFTNTRGATFTTPGTGFLQTPLGDAALTSIQASYQTTFAVFSAQRIFTPTGSNITDVTFSVPGTSGATLATVSAFGAVFSDVDQTDLTTIEFFNQAGASIYSLAVPRRAAGSPSSGTLSFAGAAANAGERIARVRITTPDALGLADSNGDPVDVVAMDDFIYAEPTAVPEPASAGLLATGLLGAVLRRRRCRR